jgi:L-ribulokinase
MNKDKFVIGVDYGTDSVRSLIINAANGEIAASSVYFYPRWRDGLYCDPSSNLFRQHPLDYIEGLEASIRGCLQQITASTSDRIKAISIDTTGSTPVAVDKTGTPLALLPGFEKNPNAMFILWKDHTAVKEAGEINVHAVKFKNNYLRYVGGIYSSEWFWSKLLHVLRSDTMVRVACDSFVEHCDWIPFLLTGGRSASEIKRCVCAAGHKALWAKEFGGLPPDDFFTTLDPLLNGFTDRLYKDTYSSDQPAGVICKEWSEKLGLPAATIVGMGAFDAHMGAVGGQIEPFHLSKVMGTSTCDMLVAPPSAVDGILVKGICGQVPGSVIPGMIGMEAGQSAFGDAYAWFRKLISWPLENLFDKNDPYLQKKIETATDSLLGQLTNQVKALPLQENAELSMDWLNGRRSPDANQLLKGAIINLSLSSDAPLIFRAIAESTCFGAKAIVDRFSEQGIPVKGLIGLGGVAKKSAYIMQMMADIIGMPIRIHHAEQSCALGAAMFAATAAGIYPKVEEAMNAMGPGFENTYEPRIENSSYYNRRYDQYRSLGRFIENITA